MSVINKYLDALTNMVHWDDKDEIESISIWLQNFKKIFFIGNGGSNAIALHMAEDFSKIARIPAYAFGDTPTVTCFANDYGYDRAIVEWLKVHFDYGSALVAISSSGESQNIINAVRAAPLDNTMILTGFAISNTLHQEHAKYHIRVPYDDYGIVECLHQIFLHAVLDTICQKKYNKI